MTDEERIKQLEPPVNPLKQFVDSLKAVMNNPVAKWTTFAGMFRYWETFSVLYFVPAFFLRVYPE